MKLLKNLNIKTIILATFFLVVLIVGAIGIAQYNNFIKIHQLYTNQQKLSKIQTALYKLQTNTAQLGLLAYQINEKSNLPDYQTVFTKYKNVKNEIDNLLTNIKTLTSSENRPTKIANTKLSKEIENFYSQLADSIQILSERYKRLYQAFINLSRNKYLLLPENQDSLKKALLQQALEGNLEITGSSPSILIQTVYAQIKEKYKQQNKKTVNLIIDKVEELNSSIKRIQTDINIIVKTNNSHLKQIRQTTTSKIIILFIVSIIISFLIIYSITTHFTSPINDILRTIRKLSLGELVNYEPVDQNNEIGYISQALNQLINALKETSKFAEELAKGNFDYEFKPLSDKDEFRNLLLELRDSLKRAKEEEEKRKIEDYQRNRVSEGLAKFAEILRGQHKDLKKLAEDIITNLVQYLNAVQGVFFILNDKDPENVYLELYAAYAWSRKKYLEKKIALGEGLIGAVALEKFTIYMTDVPEDYIEIKSGTGEADPRAILIVPVKVDENVLGVIELATFDEFKPYEIELVEKIAESVASTLQNIKINEKTEELLKYSQKQAEEMKRQEEIMRKTIEELKRSQEENLKKEQQLKKLLADLEKVNERLKIKDLELQKEIEKLRAEYNKKIKIIENLSAAYRQILMKMLSPVVIFDKDGNIEFVNNAAIEEWEYSEEELLKLNIDQLFEKSAAIEKYETFHEYLINEMDKINENLPTFFLKKKNGAITKVQLNILKIDADPDNVKYVAIITSLYEIEQKEQELKKNLARCLADELQYILKIEFLENIIRENNLLIPEIDFTQELIKWGDRFKLGIDVIDQQHQKWIEFINKLYRSLRKGDTEETLNEIFKELIDYTKYHFNFEEKYMKEFNYENYKAHRNEHEKFVNELYALFEEYLSRKSEVPYKLILFLKQWVEKHVLITDKKYVPLFKEKGLK